MDASQLTYERHSRAVYVNYRMRQLEIEQRNLYGIPRPVESISPVGGDGPDYTNWYNYVLTGPLNIDDCTLACIPRIVPPPPPVPVPPPIVFPYTYAVLEDPVDELTYRVYNVTTETWGDSIDTGYAVSDLSGYQCVGVPNGFFLTFIYFDMIEYHVVFKLISNNGTLLQTFDLDGYAYYRFLSPYLSIVLGEGTVSVFLFNIATNTFSSPSPVIITIDFSSFNGVNVVDNAGVFGLRDNTGITSFYSWNLTQTEPTLVCSTTGDTNSSNTADQSELYGGPTFNNAVVIFFNETGTIRIFAQDGTVATYETGITTYNSSIISFYGQGNLQMCYINAYNTDTSLYDIYVFPFATTYAPDATFTPIEITGLTEPQFTYKAYGPSQPSNDSNHLVVVDPIGSGNFIGGNVYVVFNGTQKVGPFNYNGSPNRIYYTPLVNIDGACLLVWNGSQLYSQVITPSINVTTLLPNMTNDITIYDTTSMFGYFPIYGSGSTEGLFLLFVRSTTGALIYQNIPSVTGKTFSYIGNNNGYNSIAHDNDNYTLLTFINGTIEEIPSWANVNWAVYITPELANGTKFSINAVTAPGNSQILCMNSTGYVITTIPYATANLNNIDFILSFYNICSFTIVSPYVIIGAIDVGGNFYSYTNVALEGYSTYTYLFTDNTIMWWLQADGGTPQFYVGFNIDTKTFNTGFSDIHTDVQMASNYPFYVDD